MDPDNPLLGGFILKASGTPKPKICFLPTASGESRNTHFGFIVALARLIVFRRIYHYSGGRLLIWGIS